MAIDPSQSTLSPNFAPAAYQMLSMGLGAAAQPYQPYTGQRYAAPSALETQAFGEFGNLQAPAAFGTATNLATQAGQTAGGLSYDPTAFNTGLGAVGDINSYMNPYMQGVAGIAAREAMRQADVSRQSEQARLAQAGAFGGSRQAIMEAERQRNLQQQVGDIYTTGLQQAYDRASKQRLDEAGLGLEAQKASELSKQFGAKYGLEGLSQQLEAAKQLGALGTQQTATEQGLAGLRLEAGERQRALDQRGLDFGYEQFKESMQYPYQQATFLSSLLQGMPVRANPYSATPGTSPTAAGIGAGAGAINFYDRLLGKQP